MREIKFRAWDGSRMHTGHTLTAISSYSSYEGASGYNYDFYDSDSEVNFCDEDKLNWMQFTGLVDKHGTELYEGDVVRCGNATGEIVWHLDGWQIKWIDGENNGLINWNGVLSTKITAKKLGKIEIIGNVWEPRNIYEKHD